MGEWYDKMKSQIKSGSSEAMDVLGSVENNFMEMQLQSRKSGEEVAKECISDADEVLATSYRLYNLLINNKTTGDAHVVVRRCPEENGLLAWKRLCTTLNPRTLASGVKVINQVLNPSKITDPKKMDIMIDYWEDKISKLESHEQGHVGSSLRHATEGLPEEGVGQVFGELGPGERRRSRTNLDQHQRGDKKYCQKPKGSNQPSTHGVRQS